MAKKALLILAPGFEEIEAVTVAGVLRRAGVDLTIAGLSGQEVLSARKIAVRADKLLSETADEFDACVLPGGMAGSQNLAASEKVKDLLLKMNSGQKIIAAICAAPAIVLAPLGVLDDKYATCFPGMQEEFNKTTKYRDEPVVIDSSIITSSGPATAMEFALAITEKLCGKTASDKVRAALLAG